MYVLAVYQSTRTSPLLKAEKATGWATSCTARLRATRAHMATAAKLTSPRYTEIVPGRRAGSREHRDAWNLRCIAS